MFSIYKLAFLIILVFVCVTNVFAENKQLKDYCTVDGEFSPKLIYLSCGVENSYQEVLRDDDKGFCTKESSYREFISLEFAKETKEFTKKAQRRNIDEHWTCVKDDEHFSFGSFISTNSAESLTKTDLSDLGIFDLKDEIDDGAMDKYRTYGFELRHRYPSAGDYHGIVQKAYANATVSESPVHPSFVVSEFDVMPFEGLVYPDIDGMVFRDIKHANKVIRAYEYLDSIFPYPHFFDLEAEEDYRSLL